MMRQIELHRLRNLRSQPDTHWHKNPVLISCKQRKFNHHLGQTYHDLSVKDLASGNWKSRKSTSDYFTINAVKSNPALNSSVASFDQFGLHKELLTGLAQLNYRRPTTVQAQMIPLMMEGKNLLCAAETGSGKTLAFLLPIIEQIHGYHSVYGPSQAPNRPLSVIVTPSRELADQIYDVVCSLSSTTPFAVDVKCGGRGTQRLLRNMPEKVVDMLVTTPGVFSKLLTNKLYDLSRLSHVVLDEADTLLDDSFSDLTLRIIRKLKVASEGRAMPGRGGVVTPLGTQISFVGATMPRDLENILADVVPTDTIEMVTSSHLNRLMPHVHQKFMRVGTSQRPEQLLVLLKSNVARHVPTIVFCNKSSTACFLAYFLNNNNIHHVCLHANMPEKVRRGRFSQFQNGESDVLVCTDIASRGLDTIRALHVINYEFPGFISDYIHRIGRVGRVGSPGVCFAVSFVTYKSDVDLLWKIETSARLNKELQNVNANIKRKLNALAQKSDAEAVEDVSDFGLQP